MGLKKISLWYMQYGDSPISVIEEPFPLFHKKISNNVDVKIKILLF